MTKRDYIFARKYRAELRKAQIALAKNPASSVTVSAGGGSKSTTFRDRKELAEEIREVNNEIAAYERSLHRGGLGIEYPRYC